MAEPLVADLQDMVGAGGGRLGQHAEQRAVSERWGVSPLWGGGHTQHRERAQRRREEMEERVEVLKERHELYTKDQHELQQARELYLRMTSTSSDTTSGQRRR
mmetsp:Transcript_38205/g.99220  ORF Transcript_38205/g.99220 Transcript_38205/m.99220 type:complete len:103 (+) Transcript_38205:570-878(+)